MPYCCVPDCRSSSKTSKVSFHQIPADVRRRILWLEAIGRKGSSEGSQWIPNQYDAVCEKHFKQDDYKQIPNKNTKHKMLKKDAVPSIFENPSYPSSKKLRQSLIKAESNIAPTELSYRSESPKDNKAKKPRLCLIETESKAAYARQSCRPDLLENDKVKKSRQCLIKAEPKTVSTKLSHRPELTRKDKAKVLCHDSTPMSTSMNTLSLHASVLQLEEENAALEEENAALKRKLNMTMSKLIEAGQTIKTLHEEKILLLEQNAKLSVDLIELLDIEKEPFERI